MCVSVLKTKYAALLLELGMSRLCHVVTKLQLSYISQVLWVMGGTSVHDMLVVEHDVMGERRTLSLADQPAVKYGMKPLTEDYADKMLVRRWSRISAIWSCGKSAFSVCMLSQDHI